MFAKATSRDLVLALVVTVAGGAALLSALLASWSPGDMNLDIEAGLATAVVGFLLALIHPVPYRQVLALYAPLIAGEYWTCRYGADAVVARGVVGTQLVIMGFVGLALALREPRPAAAPSRRPAPRATHRPAGAYP